MPGPTPLRRANTHGGIILADNRSVTGSPIWQRPVLCTEAELVEAFPEVPPPKWRPLRRMTCSLSSVTIKQSFVQTFPVLDWLPKYGWRSSFLRDFLAGLTIGFVIAPKAMAHALLAGLDPVTGIYTAFFSALVYGVMGTSKWLSLATAALPSMLFGNALKSLGMATTTEEKLVAPMLTFYIGIFTFLLNIVQFDVLVAYISPSALSAFTTGGAILIGTSQVKYLFGLRYSVDGFVQTYIALFQNIGDTNWVTLVISLFCIGYLLLSKYYLTPKVLSKCGVPDFGALVVVAVTVGVEKIFDLSGSHDVQVVGSTPAGLPAPTLPWAYALSWDLQSSLLAQGFLLAVINFILTAALSKTFARSSNSVLRLSQELRAIAAANFLGSFFGTFISGGSFSGSAIVASQKVTSLMHNFVNGLVMMIILLALTPVIELLPDATLASIVVTALTSLIDFGKAKALFKFGVEEFLLWLFTFLVTVFVGVEWGVAAGAALSLLSLVYHNSRVDLVEIGALPGTNAFRAFARFPQAQKNSFAVIFRIDTSINFSNVEIVEESLTEFILEQIKLNPDLKSLILSCESVGDLDLAAVEMLCRISDICESKGIVLMFYGWKSKAREILYHAASPASQFCTSGLVPAPLDPTRWYLTLSQAVESCEGAVKCKGEDLDEKVNPAFSLCEV